MTGIILALAIGLVAGGSLSVAAAMVFPYRRRFLRTADRMAFLVATGTTATVGFITFCLCGLTLLFQLL